MFKQNRQSLGKSELQKVNDDSSDPRTLKIIEYRQPKVHFLGDLEKVQANYSGSNLDGSSGNFYYSG